MNDRLKFALNARTVVTPVLSLAMFASAACGGGAEDRAPAANTQSTNIANARPLPPPQDQPRGNGSTSAIEDARARTHESTTPTMSVEDLGARLARGEKTYVIEVRSNDAPPAIEGAEVVRTELVDAWAAKVPKSATIVAYCT